MEVLTQDNDTWQTLGLAASRVLAKIEEIEDQRTREQTETNREKNTTKQDAQREARESVLIENRRRSSR